MDPDDYKHSKAYKFLEKIENKLEFYDNKFTGFK